MRAGSFAGHTELFPAAALGRRFACDLRLKLEGQNPTGTHKDRAAAAAVNAAIVSRSRGVSVGTCGNLGVAMARACAAARLDCRVFVPGHYRSSRTREIAAYGARLEIIRGTYEDAVEASDLHSGQSGYYNGNPSPVAIEAYGRIALEILAALGKPPDTLWVPTGNGSTLAGIHQGFRLRGNHVRLGAVGSLGNTSAITGIRECREVRLDPAGLNETPENEPLVNWRSLHAREAAVAVRDSGGWACEAADDELIEAARMLEEAEGIRVPPFAAAGLAGFLACRERLPRAGGGVHVIVLTAACAG